MSYAIISLGGKQYRVQEGQRLLVDRLAHDDGKTFHPDVLFLGGDGKAEFAPKGTPVTVKVVGSAQGEKIRIGKYKRRTGYRRHTGHRSKLTQVEIIAIGAKAAAKPRAEKTVAEKPVAEKPKPAAAAKPKAPAKPKPAAAAKPAAKPKPAPKPEAEAE
ncbi:MAG TPA: 50S ribosomal protein L21 [Gaiellaceae bacterium]|nr:50S ribosomal protein L21 [Gaiellaceae bacterium]